MAVQVRVEDEAAWSAVAAALAGLLGAGSLLLLDGELGAGKTSLVRALVAALGGDPALVASPTFTLLHRYQARVPIIHIDAYRLAGPGGLAGLGVDEEADEAIVCIEWAERVAARYAGEACWRIRLEHAPGGARRATIDAPATLPGGCLQRAGLVGSIIVP